MSELFEIFSLDFQANLQGPALLVVLAGIGLVIGVLTGLFGVAGGFLLNPALIVLMGVQETLVVGSSMSFTIGTSAAGAARHWRSRNVDLRATLILVVGALLGVLLGQSAHLRVRDVLEPGRFGILFRALYIMLLLVIAWVVSRGSKRGDGGRSPLQRMPVAPNIALRHAGLPDVSLPGLALVGVAMGVMKGLLGIGGGVLLVPLLLVVVGFNMHMAVGTSLGVVLFSSILGAVLYGRAGHVNLLLVMTLLAGSTVGVQVGAWLCERLHAQKLRRYFACVVLLAVVLLAVDLARRLLYY